jgi:AGZA family xanthine/uracil permease-like MFS transporter
MRWISRGDIDGFFGLALDNLVQLLLITRCAGLSWASRRTSSTAACSRAPRCRFSSATFLLVAGRRLAARTGRTDVCALPYGINTVSLIAHVFLIMLPAKALAVAAGAADPSRIAWQAGLVATLASGIIELAAAPFAERARKATPRAALLSTLSGIAIGFISFGFLFRAFARPIVGLTTFGVVVLTYFGRVRFKGHLPGGSSIALGTASWAVGIAPAGDMPAPRPSPAGSVVGDIIVALSGGHLRLSVGDRRDGPFQRAGVLQNIESAEAAGDLRNVRR